MLFHTPIFAAYLSAAAIPLVLYLIFKSRKRDTSLGSIYILRKLVQSQKKFSEWKRYVIISVRTLALIALALAFMQPYFPWKTPAGGEFPSSPASAHRIVLLDVSPSMSASIGAGSKRDAAILTCRQIVGSMRFPGRVDLISMDGQSQALTLENPPFSQDAVDHAVAALRPNQGAADFEKSLRRAAELFRQSPAKHKELYILSDFSAKDLQNPSALGVASRLLESSGVRVFPVALGRADSENFSLLELTPGSDLLLAGQPAVFSITVGYYGSKPSAETLLTIQNSAGEKVFDQAITLAPGAKTIEVPLSLRAGEETLTARLKEDEFPADDVIARSYRVKNELHVLVSQGINTARGFDNPREWLRLALNESSRGAAGPLDDEKRAAMMTGVSDAERAAMQKRIAAMDEAAAQNKADAAVRTVVVNANPAQLNPELFRDIDAMILLDSDNVSPEAVGAMVDYVTRGGTVLLAPGPTARPESFNAALARILPIDLARPVREQIDPEVYQQIVVDKTSDRMLRELDDARGGNIGSARFYNWYAAVPGTQRKDALPLLSLSDGAPLLMERPIGRGRVLLWTAGLGGEWQSLVVHAAYPLLFTRLLTAAAAGVHFPLNLQPGEPIIRPVDSASVRILTPEGKSEVIAAVTANQRAWLRFDATQHPGDYVVYLDPQDEKKVARYHVANGQDESDYRMVDGASKERVRELFRSDFLPAGPGLVAAVGAGYEGGLAATWFAVAVLGMLFVEAWLCRRFFA